MAIEVKGYSFVTKVVMPDRNNSYMDELCICGECGEILGPWDMEEIDTCPNCKWTLIWRKIACHEIFGGYGK